MSKTELVRQILLDLERTNQKILKNLLSVYPDFVGLNYLYERRQRLQQRLVSAQGTSEVSRTLMNGDERSSDD